MEIEKTPIRSASLSEARRHESGTRWLEAARAYLNALATDPNLTEVALAGLKRCAQRTQSDFDDESEFLQISTVLLIVGYTVSGDWRSALALANPPSDYHPRHLSSSMREKWEYLQARLSSALEQKETDSEPVWIAYLSVIDILTDKGYISDLLMMCHHAVANVPNALHRALIYFESGRIGIINQHYLSGIYFFSEAVILAPNLFDDVAQVLDLSLLEISSELVTEDKTIEFLRQYDSYDELITLRCRACSAQEIETWVNELCNDPITQNNPQFSFWLGYRLEHLAQFQNGQVKHTQYVPGSFLAYALTLERSQAQRKNYQEAFSRLIHLSLARKVQDNVIGDDEPTVDSQPHQVKNTSLELVEEGESRLLLQLKDQQRYELIISFLQEKSQAVHLSNAERARSYNALAQIALNTKDGLKNAVDYAVKGAEFDASELKLSKLIRAAKNEDDWPSLSPLLFIQLGLTEHHEKRMMIMKTIAQGERQQGLWLQSYQTLVKLGAEELSTDSSETEPDLLNPFLLTFKDSTERELASLLQVKGAALSIGKELIAQDRWGEVHRLLERLSMKGKVVLELLIQSVNQSMDTWIFAEPLLKHYAKNNDWENWLNLILTSPKRGWPTKHYGRLIVEAISKSRELESDTYSALLRLRAEWLDELEVSNEEKIAAWSDYLDEHPADLSAIESLEPSIEYTGSWEILAEAYERALPLRKMGKVRILKRLSEIYESHLDRLDLMADAQKMILELSPNNEEAGSWLTLYYAERKEWYQLSLACALWTPDSASHPVWIEAKVRALLGLNELNNAYYWWTQIPQESVKRLFIDPLLSLAERQQNGSLVLELLDLIETLDWDVAYPEPLEIEDTPPPLPSATDSYDDFDDYSSIQDSDDLIAQPSLHQERYLRLRARALSKWTRPVDSIRAVQAWEQLGRVVKEDAEVCYELVVLYNRLGRKKSLIEHLSFVENTETNIESKRQAIILGALNLETRFEEYTEAFKCWLALYEYSPKDRERSMTAFHRLASADHELSRLLMELLKLRSEHSQSQVLSTTTALEFAYLTSEKIKRRELAYAVVKNLITHPVYGTEAKWLMLRNTIPLGVWDETVHILSTAEHWRDLWMAAHFAECRLGNHQWASDLYARTLTALHEQTQESKSLHVQQSMVIIEEGAQRVNEQLRRLEDSVPPPVASMVDIEFETLSFQAEAQSEDSDQFTFPTLPSPPPLNIPQNAEAITLDDDDLELDEESLESISDSDDSEESSELDYVEEHVDLSEEGIEEDRLEIGDEAQGHLDPSEDSSEVSDELDGSMEHEGTVEDQSVQKSQSDVNEVESLHTRPSSVKQGVKVNSDLLQGSTNTISRETVDQEKPKGPLDQESSHAQSSQEQMDSDRKNDRQVELKGTSTIQSVTQESVETDETLGDDDIKKMATDVAQSDETSEGG